MADIFNEILAARERIAQDMTKQQNKGRRGHKLPPVSPYSTDVTLNERELTRQQNINRYNELLSNRERTNLSMGANSTRMDSEFYSNISREELDDADFYYDPTRGVEDFYKQRAKNQSALKQTFNFLTQVGVSEVALGIPKVFSDIAGAAYTAITGDTNGFTNPISNTIEGMQEKIKEATPIYRENPNKNWDMGDWGWWMENAVSIGSTLALLYPAKSLSGMTKEAGKLLGATKAGKVVNKGVRAIVDKGNKLITGSTNAAKAYKSMEVGGDILTTAFFSRTAENYQEARETFKSNNKDYLDAIETMTPEEREEFIARNPKYSDMSNKEIADDIASQAAKDVFYNDYWMMAMDMIQLKSIPALWKAPSKATTSAVRLAEKSARRELAALAKGEVYSPIKNNLVNRVAESLTYGIKKPWKSVLGAQLGEGIEEGFQGIMQEEGKIKGWKVINPDYQDKSLTDYITDPSILEQAFWGVVGGIAFTGFAKGTQALGNKLNEVEDKKLLESGKITQDEYDRRRYSDEKRRMAEIKKRVETTRAYVERMKALNDGYDNRRVALNDDGQKKVNPETNELEYVHLDEQSAEIEKIKATNAFVANVTLDAADVGDYDMVKDFLTSDEFNSYLRSQLPEDYAKDNTAIADIAGKMEKTYNLYSDYVRKLNYNMDTTNDYIIQMAARELVENDLVIEEENQAIDVLRQKLSRQDTQNQVTPELEQAAKLDYVSRLITRFENDKDIAKAAYEIGKINKYELQERIFDADAKIHDILKIYKNESQSELDFLKNLNLPHINDFIKEFNSYFESNVSAKEFRNSNLSKDLKALLYQISDFEIARDMKQAMKPVTDKEWRDYYKKHENIIKQFNFNLVNRSKDLVKNYIKENGIDSIYDESAPNDILEAFDIVSASIKGLDRRGAALRILTEEIERENDAEERENRNMDTSDRGALDNAREIQEQNDTANSPVEEENDETPANDVDLSSLVSPTGKPVVAYDYKALNTVGTKFKNPLNNYKESTVVSVNEDADLVTITMEGEDTLTVKRSELDKFNDVFYNKGDKVEFKSGGYATIRKFTTNPDTGEVFVNYELQDGKQARLPINKFNGLVKNAEDLDMFNALVEMIGDTTDLPEGSNVRGPLILMKDGPAAINRLYTFEQLASTVVGSDDYLSKKNALKEEVKKSANYELTDAEAKEILVNAISTAKNLLTDTTQSSISGIANSNYETIVDDKYNELYLNKLYSLFNEYVLDTKPYSDTKGRAFISLNKFVDWCNSRNNDNAYITFLQNINYIVKNKNNFQIIGQNYRLVGFQLIDEILKNPGKYFTVKSNEETIDRLQAPGWADKAFRENTLISLARYGGMVDVVFNDVMTDKEGKPLFNEDGTYMIPSDSRFGSSSLRQAQSIIFKVGEGKNYRVLYRLNVPQFSGDGKNTNLEFNVEPTTQSGIQWHLIKDIKTGIIGDAKLDSFFKDFGKALDEQEEDAVNFLVALENFDNIRKELYELRARNNLRDKADEIYKTIIDNKWVERIKTEGLFNSKAKFTETVPEHGVYLVKVNPLDFLNTFSNVVLYTDDSHSRQDVYASYTTFKEKVFENYSRTVELYHKIEDAEKPDKNGKTHIIQAKLNIKLETLPYMGDGENAGRLHPINELFTEDEIKNLTIAMNKDGIVLDENGKDLKYKEDTANSSFNGAMYINAGMEKGVPVLIPINNMAHIDRNTEMYKRLYKELIYICTSYGTGKLKFDDVAKKLTDLVGRKGHGTGLFRGVNLVVSRDTIALYVDKDNSQRPINLITFYTKGRNYATKEIIDVRNVSYIQPNGANRTMNGITDQHVEEGKNYTANQINTYARYAIDKLIGYLNYNAYIGGYNKTVTNSYIQREGTNFSVNIGGEKVVYNGYADFLISNNAFMTDRYRTDNGEFYIYYIQDSNVTANHYDSVEFEEARLKGRSSRELLTNLGLEPSLINDLLDGPSELMPIIAPKYRLYDRPTDFISYGEFDPKAKVPVGLNVKKLANRTINSREILRTIIHENIHRLIYDNKLMTKERAKELHDIFDYARKSVDDYVANESNKKDKNKYTLYSRAKRILDNMQKDFEEKKLDELALADEFATESFTNTGLMHVFNEIAYEDKQINKNKTIFQKIIDFILNLLHGGNYKIKDNTVLAAEYIAFSETIEKNIKNPDDVTPVLKDNKKARTTRTRKPKVSPVEKSNNTPEVKEVKETNNVEEEIANWSNLSDDRKIELGKTNRDKLSKEQFRESVKLRSAKNKDVKYSYYSNIDGLNEDEVDLYKANPYDNITTINESNDMANYVSQFPRQFQPKIASAIEQNQIPFVC